MKAGRLIWQTSSKDGDAGTITDPHIPTMPRPSQVSVQTRQKKKEVHTYTDVLAASHLIPHQDGPEYMASSCSHRKVDEIYA